MFRKFFVASIFLISLLVILPGCSGKKGAAAPKVDLLSFTLEKKLESGIVSNNILDHLEKEVSGWVGDSRLVSSVNQANVSQRNRTQAQIDEADRKWQDGDSGLINSYLNNAASAYLKEVADNFNGLYAEVFTMDFQGCLVGLSAQTSDFWQGDEDKFIISYNSGNGKIFIDKMELDESTNQRLVQVSVPVVDPANKQVIGAITIGMDVNKL